MTRRLRALRIFSVARTVAAALVLVAIPLATTLPALAALTLLVAIVAALIAFEVIRHAEQRAVVRHHLNVTQGDRLSPNG